MVMPGATIRKPRVNCLLPGWRTAFTVCQAISMAMTVVLPAPVASLSASRTSSGLACSLPPLMWAQNLATRGPILGATSVSQMAVSTASIWQKNGRMPPNLWWRQCFRRRAVSGVTSHWSSFGRLRQVST
jgi:hypothetical protein